MILRKTGTWILLGAGAAGLLLVLWMLYRYSAAASPMRDAVFVKCVETTLMKESEKIEEENTAAKGI